MAKQEYSNYQKKVIERYYDNLDAILLTRLQELVTELYLAETEQKRQRLWERVQKAMAKLKIPPDIAEHILTQRDIVILADNVREWLSAVQGRR